jgi:hypothetical protein
MLLWLRLLEVVHRTIQPRLKIREYIQYFSPDLDGLISIWLKLTGADPWMLGVTIIY